MNQPRNTPARQRGVSLIEGLAALCVMSIVAGGALPSFEAQFRLHQLKGTAELLETDLQLARSEAVTRNHPVRLTLNPGGLVAGSCYIVHTGPADACHCDAGQAPRCDAPAQVLRSVSITPEANVQVRSAVRSILFDGTLATSTPTATLRVESTGGASLHQVVNVVGRIRTCTVAGTVPGYRNC
ncbi:Tfp pilus assembly protein FimT [Burkholderiales bacterium JOSHI_001]|nr:Tfp pilus assembly protein FimT [Burkholderiales bacterium JOSHI_001]